MVEQLQSLLNGFSGWGLLALRVIWGSVLVLYGLPMVKNPLHWLDLGRKPSGFPGFLQAIGAFTIFFGGFAMIVGFLTPLAALGLTGAQEQMAQLWEDPVSARTISRALQKLGFSRKKRLMAIENGMSTSEQRSSNS